ncbi:TonB-dependent receptor [Seonamhaeicola sp.]|uniref:SusC/RagA family TonB-linked outer membrane protein n=1 Tax=Seonamhaeicola sp. TaxID=1912245 RepID=UPI00262AEE42|nr:TonB-dependent receptor [Seonamhaeicola sp.]
MRTFIFLFCATVFSLTPNDIVSQNSKIIIEEDKTLTVDEVFDLIMAQTDYNFFYEEGIFKEFPNIKVKKGVIKTSKLLKQSLFNGDFEITITNDYDVLIKKKEQKIVDKPQEFQVSGIVTDQNGQPLPGANIIEKGTTNGTQTDFDGNYSLTVSSSDATLVISFIGYQTKEVLIAGNATLNIVLQEDTASLDEVVVVGYGTQSRVKTSSAVAKLDYQGVEEIPNASFEQALTGVLPGVRAVESTGKPGGDSKIDIRGIGTLTAGSNPLIVLDGLPLPSGVGLDAISGNDIASVDILKDAASASIYGSRGANGVILVTTKEGRFNDKAEFTFDVSTGIQTVSNKIDFMDGYELARYQAASLNNAWEDLGGSASDPNSVRPIKYQLPPFMLPYLNNEPGLPNTDWQDVVFRNATINNYHFSVKKGSKNLKYYISGGYLDQEGIIVGTGYERFNLRANLEANISDRLTFGMNLSPSFSTSDEIIEGGHWQDGLLIGINMSLPYFSPYDSEGNLAQSTQITEGIPYGMRGVVNPLALATQIDSEENRFNLFGGIYFDYELIDGLNFKTYLGGSYFNTTNRFFRPSSAASYVDAGPTTALGRKRDDLNRNYLFENTLSYNKKIGDHTINGLLGFSYQKDNLFIDNIIAEGFSDDNVRTLNAGTIVSATNRATGNFRLQETGTWEEESALVSYFGRIQYDYKDKYLLAASLRRDGSSRFGKNNKYGWFPAISAGWRVSQEDFFDVNGIDELKIRASWGRTGNDNIPNYGAIPLVRQGGYVFDDSQVNTYELDTSPNANLSWETNETLDIGFELAILDNKVKIVADYYDAKTSNLLLNVPTPASGGYSTSLKNFGEISNKGFELNVLGDFKIGDVRWSPGFNFSTNKNEVLKLGPGQDEISSVFLHLTRVGDPIGMFYGYNHIGLYETASDLASSASYPGATVGNYKYEDVNSDGVIDANDRTIIGDPYPDYTFGITNKFEYKNFDLSFLIQGAQGYDLFLNGQFVNYTPRVQGSIFSEISDNYFISEGNPNNGEYARPTRDEIGGGFSQNSDLKIKDASYVRLRNITLGYNLGESILDKLPFERARLYVSGKNLITWTDYPLYNPETNPQPNGNGVLEPGMDWSGYPVEKSISFGLKLTF